MTPWTGLSSSGMLASMIKISASLVDGSAQDWTDSDAIYHRYIEFRDQGYEGRELVDRFLTDDWGAPPLNIELTGTLDDGTVIKEHIYCPAKKRKTR